jgi:hypothetical protein
VGCTSEVAADSLLVLGLCVQQASTVRNEVACQLASGNSMLRSRTCFLRTSSSRCRSAATLLSTFSTCSVNSTVSTLADSAIAVDSDTRGIWRGDLQEARSEKARSEFECLLACGLGTVANCSWLLNGLLFLFFTGQAPSSAARPPPNHRPASRRPRHPGEPVK